MPGNELSFDFDARRAVSLVFSFLLLVSVFLPWLSFSSFGMNISISGNHLSESLGIAAVVGGVAAAGFCFFRGDRWSGLIHVLVGVTAISVFFLFLSSYPSLNLDEGPFRGLTLDIMDVLKENGTAGLYLYLFSSVGLVISGIVGLLAG